MTIFDVQFWKNALESTLVAGLTAFAGVFTVENGYTLTGLKAAGIAGGMGALYAFIKQLGAVQSIQAITKVSTPIRPLAAPRTVPEVGK